MNKQQILEENPMCMCYFPFTVIHNTCQKHQRSTRVNINLFKKTWSDHQENAMVCCFFQSSHAYTVIKLV